MENDLRTHGVIDLAWSYNASALGTSTAAERLNSVRLLIGDTDTSDQQLQDEEITFALSQTGDNIYTSGVWAANAIASKYSRRVTTEIDGALRAEYSDLAKNYRALAGQLREDGRRYSAGALGVEAGGIFISEINTNRADTDRPQPFARMDRFQNNKAASPPDDYVYIEE